MLCKIVNTKKANNSVFAFFSGFGADDTYWNDILPHISDKFDCVLLSENYFNDEKNKVEYTEELGTKLFSGKTVFGIGHSLGYAKLCEMHRKSKAFNLTKIVAIEGFNNFLGSREPIKSIRKISIDIMKIYYSINPILTLAIFEIICGSIPPQIRHAINMNLLMHDLELLSLKFEEIDVQRLVITSVDDPIIQQDIISDNFEKLPNTKIKKTIFALHVLGMKQSKYVMSEIMKFILA